MLVNGKPGLGKIMDTSLDIICAVNSEGIVLKINSASLRILGYSPDELLGKRLYDFIYPEDIPHTKSMTNRIIAGDEVTSFENRYVRKDGSLAYLNWSARYDPTDKITYGVARDAGELKKKEADLLASEKKYKYLFENNPVPVILWDYITKRILDCNQEALHKFDYTKQEFTQLTLADIRMEEDRPLSEHTTPVEASYQDLTKTTWRYRKKNGEIMFMEITSHSLDEADRKIVVALCIDVTENRYYTELDKLEKNLLEMNAKRETSLSEMILVYLSGIELLHQHMHTSMQEKRGRQLYNIASPSLPKDYLKEIEGGEIGNNAGSCGTAAFLKEKVVVTDISTDLRWAKYKDIAARYELRACWSYPLKDGHGNVMATFACYYKATKTPSSHEENTVQRAVHILQVILDSYHQRNELQRSNERFEYATEATSDVVWDWDLEDNTVYYSQNIYKLFGHKLGNNNNNMPFYLKNIHPEDKEDIQLDPEKIKYGKMTNWTQEYRFRKADGEYAFVLDKGIVIRDKNGIGTRMVGAMQDITRQRIEDIQIALIAEISQIFNEPIDLNQSLYKILERLVDFGKCSIAEAWLIGTDKSKIVLTAKYPKTKEMQVFYERPGIQYFKKGEGLPGTVWKTSTVQYWGDIQQNESFVRRDAAKKVGLKAAYGIPLKYNNEVIGVFLIALSRAEKIEKPFISFFENYSSHLGAEIQRKQLEHEFNQIFNYTADIICVAGFDGFYKKINPAMCALLEYSEKELLEKPFMEFVHPEDRDISIQEVGEINQGKSTFYFENRHISKSGKVKWLAWTATPSPEEGLFFGVAKDVTEKKELQNLLNKASELARIGSWEIDLVKEGGIYWSQMTRNIYEVDEGFIPDHTNSASFFKDEKGRNLIIESITRAIEAGTSFDLELQIVTAKGRDKWVRIIGEPEFVHDKCLRVYGSFQDIDNRKKAGLSLEASEARYSELFHLSPLPMWVIDYATLKFLDINDACILHYGYTQEEFLGMTLTDIVVGEEVESLEKIVWQNGNDMSSYVGAFNHKKKNGEVIQVDIQSNLINYAGKKAKVALVNDITERLKYIEAIEERNKKLIEISWIQSHIIRAPLARILGLIPLIDVQPENIEDNEKILDSLRISANELDDVISNITDKTKIVGL